MKTFKHKKLGWIVENNQSSLDYSHQGKIIPKELVEESEEWEDISLNILAHKAWYKGYRIGSLIKDLENKQCIEIEEYYPKIPCSNSVNVKGVTFYSSYPDCKSYTQQFGYDLYIQTGQYNILIFKNGEWAEITEEEPHWEILEFNFNGSYTKGTYYLRSCGKYEANEGRVFYSLAEMIKNSKCHISKVRGNYPDGESIEYTIGDCVKDDNAYPMCYCIQDFCIQDHELYFKSKTFNNWIKMSRTEIKWSLVQKSKPALYDLNQIIKAINDTFDMKDKLQELFLENLNKK